MNNHFDSFSPNEMQAELDMLHKKIEKLEQLAARPPAKAGSWRRLLFCGLALAVAALLSLGLMGAQGKQDALYIDQKGNVGINQTQPEKRLDVNGDALIRGSFLINGNAAVQGQV